MNVLRMLINHPPSMEACWTLCQCSGLRFSTAMCSRSLLLSNRMHIHVLLYYNVYNLLLTSNVFILSYFPIPSLNLALPNHFISLRYHFVCFLSHVFLWLAPTMCMISVFTALVGTSCLHNEALEEYTLEVILRAFNWCSHFQPIYYILNLTWLDLKHDLI